LDLQRARAQLRLSQVLAPRVQTRGDAFALQFSAAQRRFYRSCRDAERWQWFGEPADREESEEASRTAELQQLRQANLMVARTTLLQRLRADADIDAKPGSSVSEEGSLSSEPVVPGRLFRLPERGLPAYWQGDSDGPVPRLQLVAPATWRSERLAALSLLFLNLLGVAWLVSSLPALASWLPRLWPEQDAFLGLLTSGMFGFGVLAGGLVVVGGVARLLLLGRRVLRHLHRPQPALGGETASGS
jgi:hypothetical protein